MFIFFEAIVVVFLCAIVAKFGSRCWSWELGMGMFFGAALAALAAISFVPFCERDGKMETCMSTFWNTVFGP